MNSVKVWERKCRKEELQKAMGKSILPPRCQKQAQFLWFTVEWEKIELFRKCVTRSTLKQNSDPRNRWRTKSQKWNLFVKPVLFLWLEEMGKQFGEREEGLKSNQSRTKSKAISAICHYKCKYIQIQTQIHKRGAPKSNQSHTKSKAIVISVICH